MRKWKIHIRHPERRRHARPGWDRTTARNCGPADEPLEAQRPLVRQPPMATRTVEHHAYHIRAGSERGEPGVPTLRTVLGGAVGCAVEPRDLDVDSVRSADGRPARLHFARVVERQPEYGGAGDGIGPHACALRGEFGSARVPMERESDRLNGWRLVAPRWGAGSTRSDTRRLCVQRDRAGDRAEPREEDAAERSLWRPKHACSRRGTACAGTDGGPNGRRGHCGSGGEEDDWIWPQHVGERSRCGQTT